jgi:hypothetical protein
MRTLAVEQEVLTVEIHMGQFMEHMEIMDMVEVAQTLLMETEFLESAERE